MIKPNQVAALLPRHDKERASRTILQDARAFLSIFPLIFKSALCTLV
jgi:hypothetical protein